MRFKAYIFDMDGTLIHNMHIHNEIWKVFLEELGAPMSLEEVKTVAYGKNPEIIARVFPGQYNEQERIALSRKKEARYREMFEPKPLPGVIEFLERAKAANIRLAIGTAASRDNLKHNMFHSGLGHHFETFIDAEDVIISKPDPQVFLMAASKLGVAPEDCLVFEDVPKGIEAAKRANMPSVAVATTFSAELLEQQEGVIKVIEDYVGLDLF